MSFLYENIELPEEFLRDPSYWMAIDEMESFLTTAESRFAEARNGADLITAAGHVSHELRAWGVLDSVLRMMGRPSDILNQPSRFLSYFISPDPKIQLLSKTEEMLSFATDVSSEDYPRITRFLTAAFETLPCYVGEQRATGRWKGTTFSIQWLTNQESFQSDDMQVHSISPDLLQSVMVTLEKSQKELESKNRQLAQNKKSDVLDTEKNLPLSDIFLAEELKSHLSSLNSEFLRMRDYFSRAQQLITLLVGQGRASAPIREAMRRVDWEFIDREFPSLAEQMTFDLRQALGIVDLVSSPENFSGDSGSVKIGEVFDSVLQEFRQKGYDLSGLRVHVDKDMSADVVRPLFKKLAQFLIYQFTQSPTPLSPVELSFIEGQEFNGRETVKIKIHALRLDSYTSLVRLLPIMAKGVGGHFEESKKGESMEIVFPSSIQQSPTHTKTKQQGETLCPRF